MVEKVNIRIKYLSAIRENVGHRHETASFAAGTTLQDVQTWLNHRYKLSLPSPGIMLTLNDRGWTQLPDNLSTELKDGDVICIFPAISGG